MKWLCGLGAVIAGSFAALGAVGILAWITRQVLFVWLQHVSHNPHDASIGDSAGWGLIFLSPVLGPLYLIFGIVCGALTFSLVYRRLRMSNAQTRE